MRQTITPIAKIRWSAPWSANGVRLIGPRSCSIAVAPQEALLHKKTGVPEGTPAFSLAEWTGLEPATPGVTGRYSNQLNYHSILWWVLTGSNRRPSPCKGDALPAELSTRKTSWSAPASANLRASRGAPTVRQEHSNMLFARPSGSSGALVYGILQAFASLETGDITRLDLDRFTGSRVASHTCCACLN